jgi:hypothetical protein
VSRRGNHEGTTYLSGTVLSGTLGGRQLTLAIALGASIIRRTLLRLGRGLRGSSHHSPRDGRVNVSLVARTGSVRLQVLLARSTLGTVHLVLSSQQLVMEH